MLYPQLGLKAQQIGDAEPWQILDVQLFRRYLNNNKEFLGGTSAIGSSLKLSFHPYKERHNRTPYATWASIVLQAAPGLRGGLELEFLCASTLVTRTELAIGSP
jgi:hypothetical protein